MGYLTFFQSETQRPCLEQGCREMQLLLSDYVEAAEVHPKLGGTEKLFLSIWHGSCRAWTGFGARCTLVGQCSQAQGLLLARQWLEVE